MNIAIIVRKLNVKGGVQRHALYEARELKKMGHEVRLYTFSLSKNDCYPELLKGLKVVSSEANMRAYSNYFSWKSAESRMAKELANLIDPKTEILNPHDHACYKVAYYFKKCVKNIPSVWTMHDMPTRTFAAKVALETTPNFKVSLAKKILNTLLDWYEIRKFIKKQDIIAVLDERDKTFAKKYFGKKAIVVRNGIDISKFPFYQRNAVRQQISIFMNGIFFRHRRFEDGILASKLLRDAGYDISINIAGDYNSDKRYYEELVSLIKNLGVEGKISFLGKVSEERMLELYRTSDIFLFPNHMQSWGLAVFEAMSSGLPVVVSRSAGASEILNDHQNACLVNPKSPAEIAGAVESLAKDAVLYSKMSRDGRKFVEDNLSWSKTASSYSKIFKNANAK